jgi:hypothetical protein
MEQQPTSASNNMHNHHHHIDNVLGAVVSGALLAPAWLEIVSGWLKLISLLLSVLVAVLTLRRMYLDRHKK